MSKELKDLAGYSLGEQVLEYDDRDAILYAVSVGASTEDLDLVYEKSLRTLPCYAAALGLWAVEAAGELGAYDRNRSLHASQNLVMHSAMPTSGPIATEGRVESVWDKGKAALIDIVVQSDVFTASYGIFLPGLGGWGGDRGPSASAAEDPVELNWADTSETSRDQATLYRLTGDRHPIHIDVDVARANGFDRPILHGLCTLGIAARVLAAAAQTHPANLQSLESRLAAPVMPGDAITTRAGVANDGSLHFESSVGDTQVLKSGRALFT
ncbi:MAG: MaoC/PaaZ C-terminal domain-containing protein [Woeseiaceae bacterium]